jgi:CLIP-associating protein 1/2
MAYAKPNDLDGFIALMSKSDMRIKTQLAEDLVNYLCDYENSLLCMDLGSLIDALIPWLSGSHFKVSLKLFFSIVLTAAAMIVMIR